LQAHEQFLFVGHHLFVALVFFKIGAFVVHLVQVDEVAVLHVEAERTAVQCFAHIEIVYDVPKHDAHYQQFQA
jgi:hypothetical protein